MSKAKEVPIVYLSRTEAFCSGHRLHCDKLSDEENKRIYSICNNANGHGHNYKVVVTVRGPVDPVTGMLVNMVDLKMWMNDAIISVLDHKHLDKDVPHFKDNVSSIENIAVYIWNRMLQRLPPGILYEVKLLESENDRAIYRGEMD